MEKKTANKTAVPLEGKTVLLGLTGSIAVYKSCDLVRRLGEEGANVLCLMTESARKLVTPFTFRALSRNPVIVDLWDPSVWKAAHLDCAERADLFLIAPASANTIARMAAGIADDVITTTALATRAPILIAPAMHESMWTHPATQSNVKRLKTFGVRFVGPERGSLSQGDSGIGRMSEVPVLVSAVLKTLA